MVSFPRFFGSFHQVFTFTHNEVYISTPSTFTTHIHTPTPSTQSQDMATFFSLLLEIDILTDTHISFSLHTSAKLTAFIFFLLLFLSFLLEIFFQTRKLVRLFSLNCTFTHTLFSSEPEETFVSPIPVGLAHFCLACRIQNVKC